MYLIARVRSRLRNWYSLFMILLEGDLATLRAEDVLAGVIMSMGGEVTEAQISRLSFIVARGSARLLRR